MEGLAPGHAWTATDAVAMAYGNLVLVAWASVLLGTLWLPFNAAGTMVVMLVGASTGATFLVQTAVGRRNGGGSTAALFRSPTGIGGAGMWLVTYIWPVVAIRCAVEQEGMPSPLQVMLAFVETFAIVGACMSVCLHRYFSHRAFKTSRGMQVLLCVMGCLSNQGNPLWWAAMHRRHHKHCDTPEDPHSWVQTSYMYALVGWTINPNEQAIDEHYLGSLALFPELRLIGAVWWAWPLLAAAAVYRCFGLYSMVLYASTPMLMARMVTLLFNVEYHPPPDQPLEKHDEPRPDAAAAAAAAPAPTPHQTKTTCGSVDVARFLANCVGESCHDDHHAHPMRARRPSGGFPHYDLPYIFVIKPLVCLGLIWSPRDMS